MAEYVDREQLIRALKGINTINPFKDKESIKNEMIDCALFFPAADVAEGVRCSECKHFINRQKAEIEFLRASKGLDKAEFNELKKTEIEKYRHIEETVKDFWSELKKLSAFKDLQEPTLTELLEYIDYANTEAIKEFAERLKDVPSINIAGQKHYVIVENYIYNLVKEMVGEK